MAISITIEVAIFSLDVSRWSLLGIKVVRNVFSGVSLTFVGHLELICGIVLLRGSLSIVLSPFPLKGKAKMRLNFKLERLELSKSSVLNSMYFIHTKM